MTIALPLSDGVVGTPNPRGAPTPAASGAILSIPTTLSGRERLDEVAELLAMAITSLH